jgi:hypothetical protein
MSWIGKFAAPNSAMLDCGIETRRHRTKQRAHHTIAEQRGRERTMSDEDKRREGRDNEKEGGERESKTLSQSKKC